MKLLADENVRKRLVKVLRETGHDVKIAEKGTRNSALFLLAKKENRLLLTNDTDFLGMELLPTERTGFVILRVFPDTFEDQREAILRLLGKFKAEELFGRTVELGKDREIFTK